MDARVSARVGIVVGILVVAAFASAVAWGPLGISFERDVGIWQNAIAAGLTGPAAVAGWRLYAVAFAGGLVVFVGVLAVYRGGKAMAAQEAARSEAAAGHPAVHSAPVN